MISPKYTPQLPISLCNKCGFAQSFEDLRGEGRVILGTQVVGVQIEHADHEGKEDHNKDDHKLKDVLYGAAQGDLQRSEALVGWQDVGDA